MRVLACLIVLLLGGAPGVALCQSPARPGVALVMVTLDQLRQLQAAYGRSSLEVLGDERWGRFTFEDAAIGPELFEPCLDERPEGQLDYCVRFYLSRADLAPDAAPTVVVVFDDHARGRQPDRRPDEMRVVCFGRGVVPADPAAQTTWLWPGAGLLRGTRDLDRDTDALADCIAAAASERWTGLREPDPL